jgi:hypothetical protein
MPVRFQSTVIETGVATRVRNIAYRNRIVYRDIVQCRDTIVRFC